MDNFLSNTKKRPLKIVFKACGIFVLILISFVFTKNVSATTYFNIGSFQFPCTSDTGAYFIFSFASSTPANISDANAHALFGSGVSCNFTFSDIDTGGNNIIGQEYALYFYSPNNFSTGVLEGKIYYIWNGSNFSFSDTSRTETHIELVEPYQNEIISTSTTANFSTYFYIRPSDWEDEKIILRVAYHNNKNYNQGGLLSNLGGLFLQKDTEIIYHLNNGGGIEDNVSTTSPVLDNGTYTMKTTIENSGSSFWGINWGGKILTATTTTFIANATTDWDSLHNITGDFLNNVISPTTTAAIVNSCDPFAGSWSLSDCLGLLIVPDASSIADTLGQIHDNILTRVPFGYLTRFVDIISNPATSTLPSYTVNIRTSETATTSLSFDPQDMIAGGGTLLDSVQDPIYGKTVKDILYPIVQLVIGIAVVFEIISDLTGSHKHVVNKSEHYISKK